MTEEKEAMVNGSRHDTMFGSLLKLAKPRSVNTASYYTCSVPAIIPKGKERTTFWNNTVNFFAFMQYLVFDNQGKRIENHNVQSAIESATVALDVIRGWKFKADKKWELALDLKRLSIIAPPKEKPEPKLPPLPGS
ncbi:hypothetical protein EV359DRAFT_69180 [Lentinula novae-zelandiae]|nr:hypothetical protein EV359DRAFT_69180 [Lentinula novae-zelandiae]